MGILKAVLYLWHPLAWGAAASQQAAAAGGCTLFRPLHERLPLQVKEELRDIVLSWIWSGPVYQLCFQGPWAIIRARSQARKP